VHLNSKMDRSELKLHVYFWIGLCSILILVFAWPGMLIHKTDPRDNIVIFYAAFAKITWIMLPGSAIFYFNYYIASTMKGNKRLLVLGGLTLLAIISFAFNFFGRFHNGFLLSFFGILSVLFLTFWLPFTVLSLLVYLFFKARRQKVLYNQMLKQNSEAELALLKAQLNPHFLFNTLNNIDTLIQVDEKEKASESLIRMSEMMRYTTYESGNSDVLLEEEIEYLKNFIELQMLRLSNKELVKFETRGNMADLRVAPMMLIPFVENAFKHASDKKSAEAIKISIERLGNDFTFSCVNKFDETRNFSKDKSGGVGLVNIEKRLHLLYPDKHTLTISKQNGKFEIRLTLNLYGN